MKTYRALTIVLALAVVVLAALLVSGGRKPGTETTKEMWHTNTVELWHTNAVEKWYTNSVTVQLPVTNTVVQTVTNEVVREVPAHLSARERDAAIAGYKYLNAPAIAQTSAALYKASPIALEVKIGDSVARLLGKDAEAVTKNVETVLRSRDIPIAANSPYRLTVDISSLWNTAVPDVTLLLFKLDLKENLVSQRQNDLVKGTGALWTTTSARLARNFNFTEEVKTSLKGALAKFCDDYQAAKEKEKEVASRIPVIPADFPAGAK